MFKTDMNIRPFKDARNFHVSNSRPLREDAFRQVLEMERKRSERSLKPLLMLLIDVSFLADQRDYNRDIATLLREIVGLKREIDLCGWYQEGEFLGILFAEIPLDAIDKAKEVVSAKIMERFSEVFLPEICRRITLTFYLFPKKYDGNGAQDSLTFPFYPELVFGDKTGNWAERVRRGMDLVGSLAGLLLFLPFFLIIPILIKITSPGPVFFKQERLGQFGRPFTFFKFRSMHVNNDDTIHREFINNFIAENVDTNDSGRETVIYKIQGDPRLTPLGNLLRKTSLDELPQFINVLKGDMSLVGPRPPIPYEMEKYEIWHRQRVLLQKPGITGLWQVTGRSLTTFDCMVRLDLRYIRKRSLWLDIKLLLATPIAVIRGKGAC